MLIHCKFCKDSTGEFISFDDATVYRIGDVICGTLTARYYKGVGGHNDNMVISIKEDCELNYKYRFRKLTPKESWLLMGFSLEDYEKASAVVSETQLFKQAGNSICKPVMTAVLKELFEFEEERNERD